MLTDAELTPGQEDVALAQRLIDEGWLQTSAKYRSVVGPFPEPPKASDLIRPEVLDTPAGQHLAGLWHYHLSYFIRFHYVPEKNLQRMELTVKQFKAYKKLGGGPWPIRK